MDEEQKQAFFDRFREVSDRFGRMDDEERTRLDAQWEAAPRELQDEAAEYGKIDAVIYWLVRRDLGLPDLSFEDLGKYGYRCATFFVDEVIEGAQQSASKFEAN